ncbi:hypothetical protein HIM_09816 [Hirsutella minnesotensis 3608]|uniref:Uncharacterized protein n=1 Tax=Hirsutella minnesotensis 3608 TaxID=1043627 RepID=A0A0F7ZS61_9HYPO|nr:hypothetical protein HIM_09816 [Hirsutella minnesotensis 3608]
MAHGGRGMVQDLESRRTKLITNGDVIEFLKTLPVYNAFGVFDGEQPEFLRQIYLPLRQLFGQPSFSRANYIKIQQIDRLEVPNNISSRFHRWLEEPTDFWENLIDELPRYSQQEREDRARTFFESAALLDRQIDHQRILRRFVAVSAYRLFRRATPKSSTRILTANIHKFLHQVGLPSSKQDIETYGGIIRRGKRHVDFCRKVEVGYDDNGKDEEVARGEVNDFGPLFFLDIPDSIWENKGLLATDLTSAIQHLRSKDIQKVTQQSNAKKVAGELLDYHFKLIWTANLDPSCHAVGKRGSTSQKNATSAAKRQRVEDVATPRLLMHSDSGDNHSQQRNRRASRSQGMVSPPAQDVSLQAHPPPNWQVLSTQSGGTSRFGFDVTHTPSVGEQGLQALVSAAFSADANLLVSEANLDESSEHQRQEAYLRKCNKK